ncbi:MAG: hypothetical protein AB4050_15560 [Synechococcus sp.]
MNAYKIEATLSEDGKLVLKGLPFHAGDAVEVIILEHSEGLHTAVNTQTPQKDLNPLQGSVIHYEDPFAPAVSAEDWEAIQ